MNDPCVGLDVIVCLYHQHHLVMKNMYFTCWRFQDHSLHRCCYGEELVYKLKPFINLRCVFMFSKMFLNCNHQKIKAFQDCRDMIVLIFSTH